MKNGRNFSTDLSEVNEQSDDEMSNRSFERNLRFNEKRNSIGALSMEIDNKTKTIKLSTISNNDKKVKFTNDDSESIEEQHKDGNETSDSQYESQDSNGSLKTTIRQRKISLPAFRKISDSKPISPYIEENEIRRMSMVPSMNRRDSRLQIFSDPESGVRFFINLTLF